MTAIINSFGFFLYTVGIGIIYYALTSFILGILFTPNEKKWKHLIKLIGLPISIVFMVPGMILLDHNKNVITNGTFITVYLGAVAFLITMFYLTFNIEIIENDNDRRTKILLGPLTILLITCMFTALMNVLVFADELQF